MTARKSAGSPRNVTPAERRPRTPAAPDPVPRGRPAVSCAAGRPLWTDTLCRRCHLDGITTCPGLEAVEVVEDVAGP